MPKTKVAEAVANGTLDAETAPVKKPAAPRPKPEPKDPDAVTFYSPYNNCRVRLRGKDGLFKIDRGGTTFYDKSIIEGLRKDKFFGTVFFEKKG